MFLSVNFRSVGQPVVRPRPSFRPVHPRMDFQKGGKQENSPHSRPLSCTRVYIIMCGRLTSARRDKVATFAAVGKKENTPFHVKTEGFKLSRFACRRIVLRLPILLWGRCSFKSQLLDVLPNLPHFTLNLRYFAKIRRIVSPWINLHVDQLVLITGIGTIQVFICGEITIIG